MHRLRCHRTESHAGGAHRRWEQGKFHTPLAEARDVGSLKEAARSLHSGLVVLDADAPPDPDRRTRCRHTVSFAAVNGAGDDALANTLRHFVAERRAVCSPRPSGATRGPLAQAKPRPRHRGHRADEDHRELSEILHLSLSCSAPPGSAHVSVTTAAPRARKRGSPTALRRKKVREAMRLHLGKSGRELAAQAAKPRRHVEAARSRMQNRRKSDEF